MFGGPEDVASMGLEKAQGVLREETERGQDDPEVNITNPPEMMTPRTVSVMPFVDELRPPWGTLMDALKKRNAIEKFHIYEATLPPSPFFVDRIVPILSSNNTLASLQLCHCHLSLDDMTSLIQFLSQNHSLKTIELDGNNIESLDIAKAFSKVVRNHAGLHKVSLRTCGLGLNNYILSAILDGCNNLNELDIGKNEINSEGVGITRDFLSSNPAVTILHIDGFADGAANYVTDPALPEFAGIGDVNATQFAMGMKNSTNLRQLFLSRNSLTMSSAIIDGDPNKTLTLIDLSSNKINKEAVTTIANYVKNNPSLADLNLSGNGIGDDALGGLFLALKENTALLHLNVEKNSVSDASVPGIIDALRNNTTLLTLRLEDKRGFGAMKFTIEGRQELVKKSFFDTTSLQTIEQSNHTCKVYLWEPRWAPSLGQMMRLDYSSLARKKTFVFEMQTINSFNNEGKKIRFKVLLALFGVKELFDPCSFISILELMPRLLELVQQDLSYNSVYDKNDARVDLVTVDEQGNLIRGEVERHDSIDGENAVTLSRLYEVIHEWDIALLFERGPGKVPFDEMC
mmetsp:Transcript_11116/g.24493  ORF Transcript_11116/g.24493 Transcript_11116/m.24493 type:complete len:572 (+) Transcript_11116:85-1800(+)